MLAAAPPYLTDTEVDELCAGLTQNAAKCRRLRELGYVVHRKPNGRPLIFRRALQPAAAMEEPRSALLPAPQRYQGSALEAYHRAQREATAELKAQADEDMAAWEAGAPAREAARKERRAALVRHHAAKRKAVKLQRRPPWANEAAIRAIYAEARRLTLATGVSHHVDHEIPLQGALVSGLHVETNLQILTGAENVAKRNKYEVG